MCAFSMTLPSLMGLGTSTSQQINQGVIAAGGITAGILPFVGLTAAVPVVGPIVAGITALVGALGIGNGCGGTCIEATQVVNQAEPYLQQNLAAAQQTVQQAGCLTQAEQQQLLANFDSVWQQVVQQCRQIPAPGGTQCISDRQQGSTKIGGGSWFTLYRDPIAAMPVCAPAAPSSSGTVGAAVSALTSSPILLIGLGLIAVSVLTKH